MDDDAQKHRVECAQKVVYIKGKPIASKHVNNLLGDESLVPTQVSPIHLISNKDAQNSRIHSQQNLDHTDLTSTSFLFWIYYMNLIWAFERQYLPI